LRTLIVFLLCASTLSAQPWYKDHKVWAVIGSSIASSAVATKEAHDCRLREGISFCSGGYGPFAAREAVRMSATIGLDALGLWGRHLGIREWAALPLGNTAYNAYDAYDQTLKGCPVGQWPVYGTKYNCTGGGKSYATKPDLSRVSFVRH
jgi:hypothetical protein